MNNKISILVLCMFVLVSALAPMVSAGNYLFENTTGAELVKIYGENGNVSILGDLGVTGDIYGNIYGDWNGSSDFVPYTGSLANVVLGDYNFSVGGTDLFVNSNTGNVGIGTASPLEKFHIKATTNSNLQFGHESSEFRIKATNDADTAYIPLIFRASEFNLMQGNVGIGTTDPGALLTVYESSGSQTSHFDSYDGDSYIRIRSGLDGNVEQSGISLNDGTSAKWLVAKSTTNDFRVYDYTRAGDSFRIEDNGDMFLMESGGNVGIGTDSPGAKLEVSKDSVLDTAIELLRLDVTSGTNKGGVGGYLSFRDISVYEDAGRIVSQRVGVTSDSIMAFHTREGNILTEQMRIDSSGNVGIGTTSPQNELNVVGEVNATGDIFSGGFVNASTDLCIAGGQCLSETGTGSIGGSGTANYLPVFTTSTNLGDSVLYQNGSSVGINSQDNSAALVVQSASSNRALKLNAQDGDAMFFFDTSLSQPYMKMYADGGSTTKVMLDTNGSSYFNGGNVGIGTDSPATTLHVSGAENGVRFARAADSGQRISFYTDSAANGNRIESTTKHFEIKQLTADKDILLTVESGEAMRINGSSGNVGIGTSSPSTKLEVYDDAATTQARIISSTSGKSVVSFGDTSDLSMGAIVYDNSDNSMKFTVNNEAEAMRIDSSGKVGIGTDDPQYPLQAVGSSSDVLNIRVDNASEGAEATLGFLMTTTASAIHNYAEIGAIRGSSYEQSSLVFRTAQGDVTPLTEAMRIDESGNVGIGTTNATRRLLVAEETGANFMLARKDAAIGANDLLGQISFVGGDDGSGSETWDTTDGSVLIEGYAGESHGVGDRGGYLTFSTKPEGTAVGGSAVERMRIAMDGNVGIGTDSPGYKLDLNIGTENIGLNIESSDAGSYIYFKDNHATDFYQGTNGGKFQLYNSSDSPLTTVDSTGNVGIGTTSPDYKLTLNQGGVTGSGVNDVLRIAGGDLSTSGDSTGLLFVQRDSQNDYTSAIRSITTTSNPDYLRPRLGFFTQNTDTNTIANLVERVSILADDGKVGIGTTTPQNELNVIGDLNVTGTIYNADGDAVVGGTGLANRAAFWTDSDTLSYDGNFTWDDTNKRLGIGLTNPGENLQVALKDNFANILVGGGIANLNLGQTGGSSDAVIGHNIKAAGTSGDFDVAVSHSSFGYRAITFDYSGGANTGIQFHAYNGSVTAGDALANERMRITNDGRVGIGTTTPTTKLEVDGTFKAESQSSTMELNSDGDVRIGI